jgi:hypothetical protein
MKKIVALLSSIIFGIALGVNAQTPGVDQRQQNQRERIHQGVASGELTRQETVNAVHNQRRIHRAERRAKADGVVTVRERAQLHHEQNKASQELRRNKHDIQERPGAN